MNEEDEYYYEDIIEEYEYGEKSEKTYVRFFPNISIATVTDATGELVDEIEPEVLWEGMTRQELCRYFPPKPKDKKEGKIVNLAMIIRSIMYEAYKKQGIELEEGNVRRFWYTHLKNVITRKLGMQVTDSVNVTLNTAWGHMINSGLVSYEGMNIIGGKEATRTSVIKDSPFSHIISAVEKADFYEHLKWLPQLFNCTLITAGGQPSRSVARAFIRQLKELETDLNQQFYMCVASDLDPAGYYIQEAFRKQFESAIRYYGGTGKVEIRRLFVRKDQVSERLLLSEAMPCRDKGKSEKSWKAEDTKWEYFCEQTNGGLYIPKPDGWDGRQETIKIIDGQEMVRALLEMSAFSNKVIENTMIKELLKIIKETSDETKIMIPEMMRVFELMREQAIDEVYQEWHEKLIKPLIEIFLRDTDKWGRDIFSKFLEEKGQAEGKRDEKLQEIDDEYEELIDEQHELSREREPELYESSDKLQEEIDKLEQAKGEIDNEIFERCRDIFQQIQNLEEEREQDKVPANEEYAKTYEIIKLRRKYREDKLNEFKDEKSKVFNPMEMDLKNDIKGALSSEQIIYYFKQIEVMPRFQRHIIRLLTQAKLLSEEGKTCFEHPVPAFIEPDLLKKASARHDLSIENVRNRFPEKFTDEMRIFMKEHAVEMEFELKTEVKQVDLSKQVNEAMEETEKEVENLAWMVKKKSEEKGGDEENASC